MNLKKAKRFLHMRKGYLKKSPVMVASILGIDVEVCKKARKEVLRELKNKKIKRLFFDIETTPNVVYSWRIGYNVRITHESIVKERKIMSIHWKWADEKEVYHLTWDYKQDDKKMLSDFIKIANEADEIIGHNSDKFDIRWVRTRCLFHGIGMFPEYKSLDTLKKAKESFYFNSNKLDYIAQFLGVGAKTDHEGYSLWLKCMDGDTEAFNKLLEYGDNDVIILENIYNKLRPYVKHNTHHGVLRGKDKSTCPNCGGKGEYVKTISTAAGTLQHLMKCKNCKTVYKISNAKFKKL